MDWGTKAKAQDMAEKAKALMLDPDNWKTRVWNNLGWHCALDKGHMHLGIDPCSESPTEMRFSAYLSSSKKPSGGGSSIWHPDPTIRGFDPNLVVAEQLEFARETLKALRAIVMSIDARGVIKYNKGMREVKK